MLIVNTIIVIICWFVSMYVCIHNTRMSVCEREREKDHICTYIHTYIYLRCIYIIREITIINT